MRIVIIEDEQYTAAYLRDLLTELHPDFKVIKILSTIVDAVHFFENNLLPDLIFCDIHLADGPGFEIFKRIRMDVPVVFITAYDHYALQAFKANGIDYILKPFKEKDIRDALEKYQVLHNAMMKNVFNVEALVKHISARAIAEREPSSLLVKYRDTIKPVKIAEVAFFVTGNRNLQLITFSNRKYNLSQSLEEVERMCGSGFYRVNRQVLLNRAAIEEVLQGYSRKLILKLKVDNAPDLVINKTKITDFLSWLSA